jgi:hypothetical protein
MWAYKRHMQSAADAAAVAGAAAGQFGNCISCAAKNSATANGFKDGTNSIIVTVNNPPASGPNAGQAGYVETIVKQDVPTYFMRLVGMNTVAVAANAVASFANIDHTGVPGNYNNNHSCIYALNSSASNSLSFDGVSAFISNCDIQVNSSSSSAVSFDDVNLAWMRGARMGIVGKYSTSPLILNLLNIIQPAPVTGIPPLSDPLAAMAAPTFGGCDHTNFATNPLLTLPIPPLNPGVYCGGITVNGLNVLHLNPGLYVINGGGITVKDLAVMLGSGVTFFLTGDTTHPYKGVNMNLVNASILRAPTCGQWGGILFFQDRNISAATAAANPSNFNAVAASVFEGALYFPTTSVSYTGASATNLGNVTSLLPPGIGSLLTPNPLGAPYTVIVGDQVHFTGVAVTMIGADYSGLCNGSPLKAVLVEQ